MVKPDAPQSPVDRQPRSHGEVLQESLRQEESAPDIPALVFFHDLAGSNVPPNEGLPEMETNPMDEGTNQFFRRHVLESWHNQS